MHTLEPEVYKIAVGKLAPLLQNLPGKVIAIDGWPGVGKTTLGRYLAWRFNISLIETDLFLEEGQESLSYRYDEIGRIIEKRLEIPRPVIVDGVTVLRTFEKISRSPDYLIYVSNEDPLGAGILHDEIASYDSGFSPKNRADLLLKLPTDFETPNNRTR